MKKKLLLACLLAAAFSAPALASTNKHTFKDFELSGVYNCTGHDMHDGDYKGTVTLTLDKNYSDTHYAGYRFKMDADGYGTYVGSAAADGDMLAIAFANEDASKKDYGTGIAKVTRKGSKVQFKKFYYEPEYQGGSSGIETCMHK